MFALAALVATATVALQLVPRGGSHPVLFGLFLAAITAVFVWLMWQEKLAERRAARRDFQWHCDLNEAWFFIDMEHAADMAEITARHDAKREAESLRSWLARGYFDAIYEEEMEEIERWRRRSDRRWEVRSALFSYRTTVSPHSDY